MPLVTFEPTDVNLNLPFERQPNLSYRVRIDEEFDYIELSTREEFSQLNGFINVYLETGDDRLDSPYYERFLTTLGKTASENRQPEQDEENRRKVIGSINYVPPYDDPFSAGTRIPASYDVRIVLPKVKFDELLAAARLGRLPSDITIEVEGMGYIVPPHGEGLKWDNKAFPQLHVVRVDFSVPLTSQAISREQLTPSDQASAPTRSQVNHLSEKLDRLTTAIERGLRSLLWAVLLIGALILILRILG